MKQNGKYRCDHLPGETLIAVKKHNDKQYNVKSEETGRTYLASIDMFSEPSLNLAHVNNDDCILREIKRRVDD